MLLMPLMVLMFTDEWTLIEEETVFAVVTHKAGLASGLAHNHLITAQKYQAQLTFDDQDVEAVQFSFSLNVQDLMPDLPQLQAQYGARIKELGIFSADESFSDVDEDDRAAIRKAMLSKKQLDQDRFPKIEAKVTAFRKKANGSSDDYEADVEMRIHGYKITRSLAVGVQLDADHITVESFGKFSFSEFGIKPYSAMLGAVKNQDVFHLYVSLQAVRKQADSTDGD